MFEILAFIIGGLSSGIAVAAYYRAKGKQAKDIQKAAIASIEAQGFELHRYHAPEAVEKELSALPGYLVTQEGVLEGHFSRYRPSAKEMAIQRRRAFKVVK